MRKLLLALSGALLLLAGTVAPAFAEMDLTSAKEQGLVGEKWDGTVGVVTSSAPSEIKKFVGDVNQQRLEKYKDIAEKQPTLTLEKVQLYAGKKLIEKTPTGYFIQLQGQEWTKK